MGEDNYDIIARVRTSETIVQLLAYLAVNFAIKSREPQKQNSKLKKAELAYLQKLWTNYTTKALM